MAEDDQEWAELRLSSFASFGIRKPKKRKRADAKPVE
jgi:hypothetical protein